MQDCGSVFFVESGIIESGIDDEIQYKSAVVCGGRVDPIGQNWIVFLASQYPGLNSGVLIALPTS